MQIYIHLSPSRSILNSRGLSAFFEVEMWNQNVSDIENDILSETGLNRINGELVINFWSVGSDKLILGFSVNSDTFFNKKLVLIGA